MIFRPLTDSDLESAPDWFGETALRADGWRDEHTRSAVAMLNDSLVAVGIIWTSRVHGDRYWCDIVVDPAHRRRRIGSAMFAHLSGLRASDLKFMTRGFVDDERLLFADALGARTIQIVPPSRVLTKHRAALRQSPHVRRGSDVAWEDLLAANAATYEWTHASWSPVSRGFAVALSEDLTDELDLDATSVAVDQDGRIRAVAMAYRDSHPPVVTAETVRAADPDGERLIEGVVRRTLDVLAERGTLEVEFDGHVTDPHLMPVWARLAPTGRWFRLVEIAPAVIDS